MPEIPNSPDKQKLSSNLTTPDGPTTDELDITATSSDDSSDCIILEGFEQENGPDEQQEMKTQKSSQK